MILSLPLTKKHSTMEKKINKRLNQLLASQQVHYQNLRGLHWNIKGNNFFELHLKYEELYNESQVIIDDLAERILMRGGSPDHTFQDYIKNSSISELKTTSSGKKGMEYLQGAIETLLTEEKEILSLTDEAGDEATNALMSDLIRDLEKTLWMVKAWLNN